MADTKPEEIHTNFAERFNGGDLEGLVSLYEEDAAFVPEPGQVLVGREAIRESLMGFLSLKGKIDLKTRYAVRAGDIALLSCEWEMRGTGADGEPVKLNGQTSEVARRQEDGRWLYVVDSPFGG